MSKKLDELAQKFQQDPEIPQGIKNGVNALFTSHLASGQKYERMGMLEEAIAEYAKEYDRPINTGIDAEIVEKAYCQTGEAHLKLGQIDQALVRFQEARALLKAHGVGTSPHKYIADILIEKGRLDEAIEVLEEYTQKWPQDKFMSQLLLETRKR